MRHIGLTGGIGSGKSTVAAVWVGLGATLIDTDAIARALTASGGEAIAALREEFGDEIVDPLGALDRERMRTRAFGDPSVRRRLEGILHPLIGAQALRQAAAANGSAVVFDVPLLAESSHWRMRCHRIAVVDCTVQTQVHRVTLRSGWSPEQVRSVIAQQAARSARRAVADAVIYNDNLSLAQLQAHARSLWRLWAT